MQEENRDKTDVELVSLTLQSPDNFEVLVERYEKKLLRYVRRFSGLDLESAEDALQEAFIKIYSNLNGYDQNLSFSSWAYRITHNETISYLRKHSKIKTIAIESDSEDEASLIEILKSEEDIEMDYSKKELGEKVRKAINDLPEKYRDVLILKYLQDLDYKDISDILKIPMGTVATLVNRAKKKFKEIAIQNNLNNLNQAQ